MCRDRPLYFSCLLGIKCVVSVIEMLQSFLRCALDGMGFCTVACYNAFTVQVLPSATSPVCNLCHTKSSYTSMVCEAYRWKTLCDQGHVLCEACWDKSIASYLRCKCDTAGYLSFPWHFMAQCVENALLPVCLACRARVTPASSTRAAAPGYAPAGTLSLMKASKLCRSKLCRGRAV
jgi:hypothetical protein